MNELWINDTWPASTIDGDPRMVSGSLMLTHGESGQLLMYLTVGLSGAPQTECTHVEFPLSEQHAAALGHALLGR